MTIIKTNNSTVTIADGLPKLRYSNTELSLEDFRGDSEIYNFYLQAIASFTDYENRMRELQLAEHQRK